MFDRQSLIHHSDEEKTSLADEVESRRLADIVLPFSIHTGEDSPSFPDRGQDSDIDGSWHWPCPVDKHGQRSVRTAVSAILDRVRKPRLKISGVRASSSKMEGTRTLVVISCHSSFSTGKLETTGGQRGKVMGTMGPGRQGRVEFNHEIENLREGY